MNQLTNNLSEVYLSYGYILVTIGALLEASPLSFIIPFSWLVVAGGFFAYHVPGISAILVICISTLGEWISLYVAYLLGKNNLGHLIKRFGQKHHADEAEKLFKKGKLGIFTTSMVAGITRFWSAYTAGFEKHNLKNFLVYSAIASFFWNTIIVLLGYFAAAELYTIDGAKKYISIFGWVVIGGLIINIWLKLKKHRKK